jgi:hypothetical protein
MIQLALAGGRPPDPPGPPEPSWVLVMCEGAELGREWPLVKAETSIGAGHACDVQIAEYGIPARCAVVRRTQRGEWELAIEPNVGLVSVDGRNEGTIQLQHGAWIRLGHVTLELAMARPDTLLERILAHEPARGWFKRRLARFVHDAIGNVEPRCLGLLHIETADRHAAAPTFATANELHSLAASILGAEQVSRLDDAHIGVLLPDDDVATARVLLEGLAHHLQVGPGQDPQVSVTVGIATLAPLQPPDAVFAAVEAARREAEPC